MLRVFSIKIGDQFSFIVKFKNLDQSITTLRFGLKEDYDKPMLIEKSLDNGIVQIDETTFKINFAPSDSANLLSGMYVYDLRYTIGDTPRTPLSGYIVFNDSVFNNQEES